MKRGSKPLGCDRGNAKSLQSGVWPVTSGMALRIPSAIVAVAVIIMAIVSCGRSTHPWGSGWSLGAESRGAKDGNACFEPKVCLSVARFVVANNGMLFTELSNKQSLLLEQYPGVLEPLKGAPPLTAMVSESEQEILFRRIPESPGDLYTVLYPRSATFETRSLIGLTPRFSGAETYDGFVGYLGMYKDAAADMEVVGLSFPRDFAAKARISLDPAVSLGDRGEAEVLRAVAEGAPAKPVKALQVYRMYAQFPDKPGLAVVLRYPSGDKSLFCLARGKGGELTVLPFVSQEGSTYALPVEGGGIVFEESKPEAGYTFTSSELTVLPDMDGDGGSEMFLTSEVTTILFSIRALNDSSAEEPENHCVKEIRGISFAS